MIKQFIGKNKKRKSLNNSFDHQIKEIATVNDDTVLCMNDHTYQMITEVSPINILLLDDTEKERVMFAIMQCLSGISGEFGIYSIASRLNVQDNIANIHTYKMSDQITNEVSIELLDDQIDFLKKYSDTGERSIYRFFLTTSTKAKSKELAAATLFQNFRLISSMLQSVDLGVKRLDSKEIYSLLFDLLNPDRSRRETWANDLQELLPDTACINRDGKHVDIDGYVYRHFAITGFPDQVAKFAWLSDLLSLPQTNLAYICRPKDKAQTIQKLSRKMVDLKGGRSSQKVVEQIEAEQNIDSAIDLMKDLSIRNMGFYNVTFLLSVKAKSYDELDDVVEEVKSIVGGSMRCKLSELLYNGYEPYFSSLPILYQHNKVVDHYSYNLTSEDLASLLPFASSELSMEKGILIGENLQSGGLCIVDFEDKQFENCHEVIIATSGSGKTFYIKCQALNRIPYCESTIIFDIKGEYHFPYGTRNEFSFASDIVVNPFHIRSSNVFHDSSRECIADIRATLLNKIADTIPFFQWIIPGLSPFELSLLEEDIRDMYRSYNITTDSMTMPKQFPTLRDFEQVVKEKIKDKERSDDARERRKMILASLNPYISGTYANIFNGQTNFDYDFLTVFDISNVREAIQKPLYHLLLNDMAAYCRESGIVEPTRKCVIIDECHVFADENNLQTLKFINQLIKVYRAFGVEVITATQQMSDMLNPGVRRYAQALIDNSCFKVFMKVGDADYGELTNILKFSDEEKKVLRGTGGLLQGGVKGRAVFIAGSRRALVQIKASKSQLEIIDPIQYEELYHEKSRYYGNV